MDALEVLTVAVPFAWLGMTLAISFVETPLKFRAPGITLALGLGIGRVVFSAIGRIEIVLLAVLAVLLGTSGLAGAPEVAVFVALCALVGAQILLVRPRLAVRTDAIIAGAQVPHSQQHLVFIGIDVAKLIALGALGAMLMVATVP